MKKLLIFMLAGAFCFLAAGAANAVPYITLLDEQFSASTTILHSKTLSSTANTGVDVTGYPSLTHFSLEFDYILGDRKGQVVVAGLPDPISGNDEVDPYGGWFSDAGDGFQGFDANDVPTIWKQELTLTGSWTPFSVTDVVIPYDYDVLAVGFIAAGTSGFRGIDNVSLSAKPVPEPTTMLLLGSGLVGLAGFGRKKFFKK